MARTPKRLLRILLASGALAAGFLVVDLLSSHDSASADDLVPEVVASVTTPLTPVVEAVAQTSAPVVAPVASTLTQVSAPIATPVVTSVIAPLAPVVTVLAEPLAPVAHVALDPLVPVVAPLLPVVADVVDVLPAIHALPALPAVSMTPNVTVFAGGLVLVAGAAAASVIQLLPLPGNSPAPRQAPSSPSASFSIPLVADLAFAYPVNSGRSLSAAAPTEQIPSSPTFASDSTPD